MTKIEKIVTQLDLSSDFMWVECCLLDRVMPTKRMETKKIVRFLIGNLSQIGGKMIRDEISEMAVTDKQYEMSVLSYPRSAKKNGVTILKFISAT